MMAVMGNRTGRAAGVAATRASALDVASPTIASTLAPALGLALAPALGLALALALVAGCGGIVSNAGSDPGTLALDPSTIAPSAPLPSTCSAPYVLEPPGRDRWIEAAAKQKPANLGIWWTRRMQGPFRSQDDAAPGCQQLEALPAAPPFDAIVHCATGDRRKPPGPTNVAQHALLLHTVHGWWSQELVRERWPRGGPHEELRVAQVDGLAAADRFGDGAVEITAIAEDGPPGGAKNRRLIVCGVGRSSIPACADIRLSAGGPFHGPGTLLYRLELACNGALTIAGWEGGVQPKLVHGRGRVTFP
jgi:hypothetical protein